MKNNKILAELRNTLNHHVDCWLTKDHIMKDMVDFLTAQLESEVNVNDELMKVVIDYLDIARKDSELDLNSMAEGMYGEILNAVETDKESDK